MNVANVFLTFGSFNQTNEQTVQNAPLQIQGGSSFQKLLGQKVEQYAGNEPSAEPIVSLTDIETKLATILPVFFGKSKEEIIEILGEEITDLFYPILKQLERFVEGNELSDVGEDFDTDELSNLIAMLFAPANSTNNAVFNQTEAAPNMSRETATAFYRLLSVIETLVVQHNQHKNNLQPEKNEPLQLQMQKYEQAVSKAIEELKANLQNHQQAKHRFTDDNGQTKTPVFFKQNVIPFHETAMDRIHQLEWRIQLLDESDSTTFVKEFEKILLNSHLRTFKNGLTELQLRLYPEHLGRLSIQLLHQDGTLIAKITTQTEAAKKLIESQINQLRHALVAQNIQIERIEITTNSNVEQQEQDQPDAQERENQEHETNRANREEDQLNDEEQSFQEWLESLV